MAAMKTISRAEFHRRLMFAEYASKAGKASQASGKAHRWTREDGLNWGRLGGQCARDNRLRTTRAKETRA